MLDAEIKYFGIGTDRRGGGAASFLDQKVEAHLMACGFTSSSLVLRRVRNWQQCKCFVREGLFVWMSFFKGGGSIDQPTKQSLPFSRVAVSRRRRWLSSCGGGVSVTPFAFSRTTNERGSMIMVATLFEICYGSVAESTLFIAMYRIGLRSTRIP